MCSLSFKCRSSDFPGLHSMVLRSGHAGVEGVFCDLLRIEFAFLHDSYAVSPPKADF